MKKNKNIFQFLIGVALSTLFVSGCNKWDDHNKLTDAEVGKDLLQQIQENQDLSKFAELLAKSGYDKVIASSQNYTVFAPVNAALASLDPAIISNQDQLRLFVGNHITNQLVKTSTTQVRIQMINGKYNNFKGATLEDAGITRTDVYAKNGYLNILNKMVPALSNVWEFVQSSALMPGSQKAFMISLASPGGSNNYFTSVYDLRDESKQYSFFVLNDTAWASAVNKYKPYFVTGTPDSTTNMASSAVVRDFTIEAVYQPNSIPDTIFSKFNAKVGVDKTAIMQTIKVSNGTVYIMSKLDVLPQHKFQPYLIQGENYDFSRVDRRNNTYFRDKFNTITGKDFRDVLVYNHGVAQFYLGYRLANVPSMKYRATWVALHDNINAYTGTFRQLLGIGTSTATLLPYTTVTANNYNEVILGEFTLTTFRPILDVYLTADNTTTANTNIVTADYIRIEPVL
jgi:uncharacterized surface protein with fasciclin (FAS1) repeats